MRERGDVAVLPVGEVSAERGGVRGVRVVAEGAEEPAHGTTLTLGHRARNIAQYMPIYPSLYRLPFNTNSKCT